MNLLGAANYDPAVAVSKATSSLLAMTAVDTTNLRVAITVPAHGKIYVRMMCTVVGATTVPAILLGVLNGVTVVGRTAPQIYTGTNSAATSQATAFAEFVVSGLTPGAMNLDAAYAVQVIVASTNIKFGGPNTNAGANAWGSFVFEVWDPQPMPVAIAPGAAGGLLIAGANAASTFATMTVTGAFSVNGVNAVSQTGDSFARLGAPVGASTSADIALIQADTNDLQTRLPAALVSGHMDSSVTVNNDKTGYALSAAGVQAVWDALTSALTTVGSIGKLIVTNLDALISSRASPTNITAGVITTVTNLTNAPGSGDFTAAMKTSLNAATPAVTVSDKTGFSLTQSFPANFSALGIGLTGHISNVDTLTTYTGNTVQTGDSFARIGAAGAGLTALGDTRVAHLDADVSSRLATAGYTAPDNTDVVAIKTTIGVAGAGLTALGDTRLAHLDADVSTRLASSGYTAPDNADITSIKATIGVAGAGLTALGDTRLAHLDADVSSRFATAGYTAPDNADITAIKTTIGVAGAGLTALGDARLAHLDADVSSRLATTGYTAPPSAATISGNVWDIVLSGHLTSGTTGAALNGAGAAGDPWTTTLPGAYGAGTAGNIVGNNLDAAVSTRLAASGYTAPDNTDIVAIRARTDNLPPDPADASDIAALFAAVNNSIGALNNLSAAGVRAAVGLAVANLDTQLSGIQTTVNSVPTDAQLTTALAGADDATLAAIAALSIPTAVAIANEVATRTLNANLKEVNSVVLKGDGVTTPWGPV